MSEYPSAIWRPTSKCGYPNDNVHLNMGVVLHSAEGSVAGLQSVIDGPREASWHFEVHKNGTVIQRVSVSQIAWTNGSYESNRRYWGIEHEGRSPEPLTEAQFQASYALVKWLFAQAGITQWERRVTLFEHRELGPFGSAATSCPGGRIPWERYKEEDMDEVTVRTIVADMLGKWARGRDQVDLARIISGASADPDLVHAIQQAVGHPHPAGGTAGPHDHPFSGTTGPT